MSKGKSWFNKFSSLFQKHGDQLCLNDSRLFAQISLLAKNRFRWEGLPDGIESRHIEELLFTDGQCAFYKDDNLGLLVLRSNPTGGINIYSDPVNISLTGQGGGYQKIVPAGDCVRVMANDICLPSVYQVEHYTTLIDEIEKTMFLNLRQQRLPFIIPTTKENELSVKKLLNKVENFELAILTDKRMDMGGDNGLNVLSTNVPFLLKDLQEYKNDTMNEMLSWLGLNNTNNNKKERLLVDEVNVNNGHILMNLDNEFKNRELACKMVNEMYGTNISVKKVIDELEVTFHGSNDDRIKDDTE